MSLKYQGAYVKFERVQTCDVEAPLVLKLADRVDGPPASLHSAWGVSVYNRFGKRALDLAVTLLLAPLFLPLIGFCALLVALDGHTPFYAQRRVGQNGRVFRMWKLRSMVPGADAVLQAHLAADPAARQEWAHHQKLMRDPRITRVGQVLRAFSFDELPQFWNVLRGEMSLVGPRPMTPEQMPLYPGHAYYRLRPGLTGPWQVSDRHTSSFADRALHDDAYAQQIGFRTDLKLIVATVGVMLRGTGC